MNNYEELNSKKYLILILLICVIFLILIVKAFTYLPDSSQNSNIETQNNIELSNSSFQNNQENPSELKEENVDSSNDSKNLNVTLPAPDKISEIENNTSSINTENELSSIETELSNTEEKPQELSPEEQAEKILMQGAKYKQDKQYVKALEEYNKISSITKDSYYIARSYEEIATVYAIVKRYGTALSFAQKAYNTSPSSSREMLLARLYYKTGDIDKATQRVNNVLQRDFAADR